MSKIDFKSIYENIQLEKEYGITTEEDEKKESSNKESSDKKDSKENKTKATPESIIKDMMKFEPSQLLKFVAQQEDTGAKRWLLKNLIPFVIYAVKNNYIKAKALGSAIKNIGDKNKDDETGIDYDNVEIEESSIKTVYAFDDETIEKLQKFIDEYKKEMEAAKDDIETSSEELSKDIKKSGVKIEGEKLADNALTVAGVIDNEENKGKSGKELTKIVDQKIEAKKEIKEIEKKAEEIKKLTDKIKVDPKYEKMSPEELDKLASKGEKKNNKEEDDSKLVKELSEKVKSKIGKDYKSSVIASIFNGDEFRKFAKQLGFNLAVDKVAKAEKIAGCRVDYYDDEASDVVAEGDSGWKINILKGDEKNKGLKKITDYIEKQMKAILKDKLGKIYKIRRRWAGDNPDGEFDSIFVFAEYKNDVKESITEADEMVNEAENPVSLDNMVAAMAIQMAKYVKDNKGTEYEITDSDATKMLEDWAYNAGKDQDYDGDMLEEIKDTIGLKFKAAINNIDAVKDFTNDTAMKVADKMITLNMDDSSVDIEDYTFDGVRKLAKQISKGVTGELEELMSNVSINGNKIYGFSSGPAIDLAAKSMGISDDDLISKFARFPGRSNSMRMAEKKLGLYITKFLVDYDKNPEQAVKNIKKLGFSSQQKDVLAEIVCKLKPDAEEAFEKAGINIDGSLMSAAKQAASSAANKAIDNADKLDSIKTGFAQYADGTSRPAFSYSTMSQQISNLDDMLDDGKLDGSEYKKILKMGSRIADYQQWAAENANSKDPTVLAKVAQINMLAKKFNEFEAENADKYLEASNEYNAAAGRIPEAGENGKNVAKLADNEETKEVAKGWLGKAAKVLRVFGQAKIVAKFGKFVLNQGKEGVDAIGGQYVKFKEDQNVIAEMKFILMNAKDNSTKHSDTKFSVRFDTSDLKWHLTNLDDRKAKIEKEDVLMKKILDTKECKEFKKECLDNWTKLLQPKDEANKFVPYFIKNYDKLGVKITDKNQKKYFDTLKKLIDNFDEVKKQFA